MTTLYDKIAGHSVEPLAALSDGVFAVAMTLLVLDLKVPVAETIHNEHDLWQALAALSPRILMYMMSFLTLGIFWVGQQTQLNHLEQSDRGLTWIHIVFFLWSPSHPSQLLCWRSLLRTAWRFWSTGLIS